MISIDISFTRQCSITKEPLAYNIQAKTIKILLNIQLNLTVNTVFSLPDIDNVSIECKNTYLTNAVLLNVLLHINKPLESLPTDVEHMFLIAMLCDFLYDIIRTDTRRK